MNDTHIPFRLRGLRPIALAAGSTATLVYCLAVGASPGDCTRLAKLHLPAALVLDAELIPAGRFKANGLEGQPGLAAFCRVVGQLPGRNVTSRRTFTVERPLHQPESLENDRMPPFIDSGDIRESSRSNDCNLEVFLAGASGDVQFGRFNSRSIAWKRGYERPGDGGVRARLAIGEAGTGSLSGSGLCAPTNPGSRTG